MFQNINDFFDRSKLYSENGQSVTLQEFQSFLIEEQHDNLGNDERTLSAFMRDYLQDPQRDVQEPYFTITEFVDFLFSKQNDLWNTKKDTVYQDMTRPLAHYWIASSHNTYVFITCMGYSISNPQKTDLTHLILHLDKT